MLHEIEKPKISEKTQEKGQTVDPIIHHQKMSCSEYGLLITSKRPLYYHRNVWCSNSNYRVVPINSLPRFGYDIISWVVFSTIPGGSFDRIW